MVWFSPNIYLSSSKKQLAESIRLSSLYRREDPTTQHTYFEACTSSPSMSAHATQRRSKHLKQNPRIKSPEVPESRQMQVFRWYLLGKCNQKGRDQHTRNAVDAKEGCGGYLNSDKYPGFPDRGSARYNMNCNSFSFCEKSLTLEPKRILYGLCLVS